ncbi:hypothetical protein BOX15_Mlig024680g3 [Macrostomum lignano]|uniref:Uncharacterized protein n=1 Tax=Macrostomum lignano TaxID=282301 RepID=A0A267E6M4_9PLAT|nr:hypothetical protein BOX15_Mlig024680g3 [Macrostomum lignano]
MSRSDPSAEMPQVEKLPAAERIRLAKKRRAQQLKRYAQWSKAMDKKGHQVRNLTGDDPSRMVRFSQNIVLLEAAARGDIDEVRSLLKSGVNPNAANDDGLTALHQCCIDNSEAMCRLLLEFNADVNARDTEQWTPLHAAATCGHIAICRLLVNSGAELLAVNADGNMPYDICEESGTLDYIEGEMARRGITQQQIDDTRLVPEKRMLQDVTRIFEQSESKAACRQQFNKLDSQGANLLHVACASGFLSVIVYLLDQVRVPLDTRDKDGWAPVHVAACWGQLDAIEALAARGADLDSRTTSGETVYDMCEDPQVRQRLDTIKKEAELQRLNRAPSVKGPSRKPSMTRGASVRRSSMRDKNLMSRKEARQEAQMLPFLTPEEDAAGRAIESQPPQLPPPTDPADIAIAVPQQPQQKPTIQPRLPRQQQPAQPQVPPQTAPAPLQPQQSPQQAPQQAPQQPQQALQQPQQSPQQAPQQPQQAPRPILAPANRFGATQPQPQRNGGYPVPPGSAVYPRVPSQQGLAAAGGGGNRMRFAGTAGDTDLVVGEPPKSKVTCCSVM